MWCSQSVDICCWFFTLDNYLQKRSVVPVVVVQMVTGKVGETRRKMHGIGCTAGVHLVHVTMQNESAGMNAMQILMSLTANILM